LGYLIAKSSPSESKESFVTSVERETVARFWKIPEIDVHSITCGLSLSMSLFSEIPPAKAATQHCTEGWGGKGILL